MRSIVAALYNSSQLSTSLSNFIFFIEIKNYWWDIETVKFHWAVKQRKSFRASDLPHIYKKKKVLHYRNFFSHMIEYTKSFHIIFDGVHVNIHIQK